MKMMQRRMLSGLAGVTRPRVLILGTGWGGAKIARNLDKENYDVQVISPANHFLCALVRTRILELRLLRVLSSTCV